MIMDDIVRKKSANASELSRNGLLGLVRSLKIVGNPKVEICSHLQTPHQRCLKSPVEPDRISEKGRNNAGSAVSDNRGASKTWDGAGGGNRTHGLGIMSPSLCH